MPSNNDHIEYERIASFLSGESSTEEKLFIENWINSSPENKKHFNTCKLLFEGSRSKAASLDFDIDLAWNKIDARISDNADIEKKIRPLYYYISGIAASLLLFGFWLFTVIGSGTVEYTAENEILKVYLPDSSFAVLNIGSKISFEEDFGLAHRDISMEGNVYFDVLKNEDIPFIIEASRSTVKVLGTAFLVEDNSKITKVTVERGLVSLKIESDTSSLFIKPNYLGSINKLDRETNLEKLSSLNHLYWANHKLIYRQESLETIFNELSKIFNKRFDFELNSSQKCYITGIFREQNLNSLLKNLALSADFEFVVNEDSVQITSILCADE